MRLSNAMVMLLICYLPLSIEPVEFEVHKAAVAFLPRDALLSAVCHLCVSVCVSVCVCVSVTLWYCIKTAKHRITQTTPHDSPMTLVF